jgi:hypothetical protein
MEFHLSYDMLQVLVTGRLSHLIKDDRKAHVNDISGKGVRHVATQIRR